MAKKKKLPKALRASASLDSHKRQTEKIKEVLKHNKQVDADKLAKKKLIEANKKLLAAARK